MVKHMNFSDEVSFFFPFFRSFIKRKRQCVSSKLDPYTCNYLNFIRKRMYRKQENKKIIEMRINIGYREKKKIIKPFNLLSRK